MRGEDLQGLSVEDLQRLEKSLEVGLGRVIEKKVRHIIYHFINQSIYMYIWFLLVILG